MNECNARVMHIRGGLGGGEGGQDEGGGTYEIYEEEPWRVPPQV